MNYETAVLEALCVSVWFMQFDLLTDTNRYYPHLIMGGNNENMKYEMFT